MAHVAGEVDTEASPAAVEELGEGVGLLPSDPAQGDGVHVLDLGEDAGEEAPVLGA